MPHLHDGTVPNSPPFKLDNPIIKLPCDVVRRLYSKLVINGASLVLYGTTCCYQWMGTHYLTNHGRDRTYARTEHKLGQVLRDGSMLKMAAFKAKYVLGDNSFLTCAQLKDCAKLEVIARGQELSQTSTGSCAFPLPTAIPRSAIAARSGN